MSSDLSSALCAQTDPELFFDNGNAKDPRRVCARCPLRPVDQGGDGACRERIRYHERGAGVGYRWGIWAGLSAKQRYEEDYGRCGWCGVEVDGVACHAHRDLAGRQMDDILRLFDGFRLTAGQGNDPLLDHGSTWAETRGRVIEPDAA